MTTVTKHYPDITIDYFDPRARTLEQSAVDALKKTPNKGKLDVEGVIGLSQSVAKYDLLTFKSDAVLMLEAIDAEFIAIAVRKIVLDIANPKFKAYISRPIGSLESAILTALDGQPGINGKGGVHGQDGAHGADGKSGQRGYDGGDGARGKTRQMPPILIFTQELKFGSNATPSKQYFNFYFPGFRGGNGGLAGNGGKGGYGGNGGNGVPGLFDCKDGPGNGGRGGDGGNGGNGGAAGNGGNGGRIYIFAPDVGIFDFTTANIEGGLPGNVGGAGTGGRRGEGGKGGAAVGNCLFSGGTGKPGRLGKEGLIGSNGISGVRGEHILANRQNGDIFQA